MKLLKRIFDFYLDASIHVALALFALLEVSSLTLNISHDVHLAMFLFFGTISAYNFIKYGVEAEKYILVANRYQKSIQLFSLASLVFAIYHAYFLPMTTWPVIGGLLLLTGVYALPVLPKAKNVRSWGGLKIFVVALVWAGATVLLLIVSKNYPVSWDVAMEAVQRFLIVLILMVPFEIRDLAYDRPELRTVPQRLGVANTKVFGGIALVLFFFITFLKDDVSIQETISKGTLFLLLGCMVLVTKRDQGKYFASFWVEAVPVFWWGMVWVLKRY